MGALVSTLKNNIYTTSIPDQSYNIVVQPPTQAPMPSITNNTSSQPTTQKAQPQNTQNVTITNQYNTNVITVSSKDQSSMVKSQINNTSSFFQPNVVMPTMQNQQPNLNTIYYNTSNVNPTSSSSSTSSSQNLMQQNISYTVNPQHPTPNTSITIKENDVQNQQLNAINTIQQQSFKPALDYIVGSFMDSIDSMNEKLESKNIFSVDQGFKTIPNEASKDTSKINYNSNMLLLFPPNQESQTVMASQLQQIQKTQQNKPYSVPLQSTVESTVIGNNPTPAPPTIIMGPPPVPKKKHQKQILSSSNNNINNNNNNNSSKQDQLTPQIDNKMIPSPNTMNTPSTIQPSPVLSTEERRSSVDNTGEG